MLENGTKTTNGKQLLFEVMMKKNKLRKLHPRSNRRSSNFLSKRLGKIAPKKIRKGTEERDNNSKFLGLNKRSMERHGRKRGTPRFGMKNKNL